MDLVGALVLRDQAERLLDVELLQRGEVHPFGDLELEGCGALFPELQRMAKHPFSVFERQDEAVDFEPGRLLVHPDPPWVAQHGEGLQVDIFLV